MGDFGEMFRFNSSFWLKIGKIGLKIWLYYTKGGQPRKCPEMWLFLYKSCLNDITRWFKMFGAKRTTPVVWTESSSNFGTGCLRIEPPHSTQGLFSPQNTTRVLRYDQELFDMRIWWNMVFHPFGHPLCWLFKGKWAKMGYLANYCSVLPHFCCNDIL